MLYIKPNDSDLEYAVITLTPFKTSHGYDAIRVTSATEIPTMSEGFKLYRDDEKLVCDYSDYIYKHSEDSYSVFDDSETSGKPSNKPLPPSGYDRLVSKMNQLNSQINSITPLTMSKSVYIDDTYCIFDYVKGGNISAWLITSNTQMPCNFEVNENQIIVYFDKLEEVGTVEISIQ